MASASPTLVKMTALLFGVMSLRVTISGALMVWRFGALWDAAFFLGVAACLLLTAIGMYRGRMNALSLGVAALVTVAARLMLDAAPIIKFSLAQPVKWLPLGFACTMGVMALLLAVTSSTRRWFAESRVD